MFPLKYLIGVGGAGVGIYYGTQQGKTTNEKSDQPKVIFLDEPQQQSNSLSLAGPEEPSAKPSDKLLSK